MEQVQGEVPIAIIGMAGRFPGADDVDTFWRNISTGVESFTVFSDEELLAAGEDPAVFTKPTYVRSRPVLNDIRGFDAGFFGLSPREATLADPQQLLFVECVWEALEAAGYVTAQGRGTVGVFAGMNISTYLLTRPNAFSMGVEIDGLMVGNDKDALATNVSYRLDLRGPSVTVQTFCSTSLVATHLAAASLRRGECDVALAGGVSIRVPDRTGYVYHEGNQASPDGHVRTFDAQAKGSMFGDGVAVVVLKRLDKALQDRDTVLAVIRGSAINNDGALKFSFQAPSIDGQRRCIAAAIADSGVNPADISYVEAHGTATEVGDPMEVAALTSAFGPVDADQYCLLGSVKPNVGHLDRASGVTGLIKVVQSLRHDLIPGTRNFTSPNPEIDFVRSPFRVTAEPTPWPRTPEKPRIAGLSSLGTGGTNSHAIIAEAPEPAPRRDRPERFQVLTVSARSETAADKACADLARRLTDEPGLDLGDVAYTLQAGRRTFNHKRVVVADTAEAAVRALTGGAGRLGRNDATVGRASAFLIAGVGEQYPGMVADLYTRDDAFKADVDACLAILGIAEAGQLSPMFVPSTAGAAPDLARLLGRTSEPAPAPADEPHLAQPAVFVAEYALARRLVRAGVQPSIMLGYSLGEYVAACLAGVLTLAEAVRLVQYRAGLIAALPQGAMLAVAADEQRIGDVADSLDVAVRTGSQVVLAGPADAIEAAAARLRELEIGCRRLDTSHAYHSRMLAPAADELTAWVAANVDPQPPVLTYLSNVTGEPITAELVADPGYWARHMCGTVEFGAGLARLLGEAGEPALVEIGAGQSLGALTRAHPACTPARWPLIVATLPGANDPRPAQAAFAEALGRLWLTGVTVDWPAVHYDPSGGWRPGRVPLPTYPFERQEYWLEAEVGGPAAASAVDENDPSSILTGLPRLPEDHWINVPVWRQTTPRAAADGDGPWLVYTDTGLPEALSTALTERLEATVVHVRPGERFAATADGFTVRPGSPEDALAALKALAARDIRPAHVVHLWNATDAEAGTEQSLRRGLHTLVALARAAGDAGLPAYTLNVVTAGSHRVLPGDRLHPVTATVLGPCRLIPVEYPNVRTRLIDIDLATAAGSPHALLTELRAEPADQVVALRGGRRWVPTYEVLDTSTTGPAAATIREGGVYLVTGGIGGIGLAMAERLAAQHRAKLVLLSRTPVPPRDEWGHILAAPGTTDEVRRRLDGLQRLEAAGAAFVTVAGDVADPDVVRAAVDLARDRFGALHGVLHCAGVPAVGLMQFKTAADMAKVLAPKLAGTLNIAAAVRDVPLDFVALYSSTTSATGGGAGQVDYCAANAFLDAYAVSDPLPGVVVTSVGWGEWTWNGWTSGLDNYDEGSRQFFEQYRETMGIGFDQGWDALRRILRTGEQHVVVSTQSFVPIVAMSRRSSIASHQATVKKARDALGRHPRPDLSTSYVEPQSATEKTIAEVWTEALGLETVGIHDNFFELGGNSLIGMEIIAQVRTALGLGNLPPHVLYQAPTVASLAEAALAADQPDADSAQQQTAARDLHRSRIEQRRSTLRSGRQ